MSNFDDIKNETKQVASDAFAQTKEKVSSACHQVKDEMDHMASQACNKAGYIYKAACKDVDGLARIVREKPMTSVLIAAGVAWLLARLSKN